MMNMLKNEEDYSIIAIHNHPGSTPPSMDDVFVLTKRKYKDGIIACHDGTVFEYHVLSDDGAFNIPAYELALDQLLDEEYNIDEFEERALRSGVLVRRL